VSATEPRHQQHEPAHAKDRPARDRFYAILGLQTLRRPMAAIEASDREITGWIVGLVNELVHTPH
jgi:hypothetical protein